VCCLRNSAQKAFTVNRDLSPGCRPADWTRRGNDVQDVAPAADR
jgi:hypothetical protein